jgi:hypothetical protein
MIEFSQKASSYRTVPSNLVSDLAIIHESNKNFISFAGYFFQTEIPTLPDRIFSIRCSVFEEMEWAELVENVTM